TWGGWEKESDTIKVDLARYARIAFKHRWVILGALLTALVIGLVITLLSTRIYTASATLQIDRQTAQVLEGADVAPAEALIQGEEFFQTQYGLLRSRSLAERVVDNLGLAASDAFLEQMKVEPPSSDSTVRTRRLHLHLLQE